MNALQLVQLLNAVISVAVNATVTVQKISDVLSKAQAEGRDVTDEEVAAISTESDALTEKARTILANLGAVNV